MCDMDMPYDPDDTYELTTDNVIKDNGYLHEI